MKYFDLSIDIVSELGQMFSCAIPCNRARDPVCGSDDVSHWNECQLRSKACDFPERNITVKHPGNCTTGASYAAASLELKMDCALAFVKHAHFQSSL